MRIYLDTNVIIDFLIQREPFFEDSYKVIQLGLEGEVEIIISAGDINTVYYVIKKNLINATAAREKIFLLSNYIKICNATAEDITKAIILFVNDFEDAVVAAIARREKADFIITRNEEDFENSPVPAINPTQFLEQYRLLQHR